MENSKNNNINSSNSLVAADKNEENVSLLDFSSILGAPDLELLELDFLKTNLDSIFDLTLLEIFKITDTSSDLAHGCVCAETQLPGASF